MNSSFLAGEIDREYRLKKHWKKKKQQRQQCKEIECSKCKFNKICEGSDIDAEREEE